MALAHLKIKSRSQLLLIAAVALLLMNARNFLTLSHIAHLDINPHRRAAVLPSSSGISCKPTPNPRPSLKPQSPTRGQTATLAVTGTTLLLVSRFAHLKPSLHGLSDISGWLLVLACWLLPKSPWQAVAVAGLYLIVLSDIRWKEFPSFRGVPIYVHDRSRSPLASGIRTNLPLPLPPQTIRTKLTPCASLSSAPAKPADSSQK